MSSEASAPNAGFTLIEIVVALLILSIAVPVLMGVFGTGLRRTAVLQDEASADSLARSFLAGVGTERPLVDGEQTGRFPNGAEWRLRISSYGEDSERAAWPVLPHVVLLDVFWNDGGARRLIELTTLRLGPRGTLQ